jgi:hypothetical protein
MTRALAGRIPGERNGNGPTVDDGERSGEAFQRGAALRVDMFGGAWIAGCDPGGRAAMARAEANRQGYVPWAWYGDAEYPQLNMNDTWSGPLNACGKNAIAGFSTTSKRATIFR